MDPDVQSLLNRIDNDFKYHAPTGNTQEFYNRFRACVKDAAITVVECVPAGREKALALTKLEEAVFWANAGVARTGFANGMTNQPQAVAP